MLTPTTYKIARECSKCGHKDEIEVSKREAAFELVDINNLLGNVCNNCSSKRFTIYYQKPDLDYELLKEWASNSDLFLMEQDEDLVIAEDKYLDIILSIIDTETILDYKRNLLIEALCVIIYDNSNDHNSQQDIELKKRVIEELNKRLEKLILADEWIMEYIKKVVYPQLQFDRKNSS